MRRLLLPLLLVVLLLALAAPAAAKPDSARSFSRIKGNFTWIWSGGPQKTTVSARGDHAGATGAIYWADMTADGTTLDSWVRYRVAGLFVEGDRAVLLAKQKARSDGEALRSDYEVFILIDGGTASGWFCVDAGSTATRWRTAEPYQAALDAYDQGFFEAYTFSFRGALSIR